MGKKVSWWALVACLAATLVLGGLGCGELGKVDQGRVIAFDNAKATVTFINDVKHDPANPDYSGAPMTFALPTDPADRGEDPKAGKRMKLDTKTREIVIYDMLTRSMKKITYTLIDQKEKVAKDSPLVEGKKFPHGGERQEGHHGLFRPAEIADDLLGAGGILGPAGQYLGSRETKCASTTKSRARP